MGIGNCLSEFFSMELDLRLSKIIYWSIEQSMLKKPLKLEHRAERVKETVECVRTFNLAKTMQRFYESIGSSTSYLKNVPV